MEILCKLFESIPTIQAGQFILRELQIDDGAALFPTLHDEENSKFTVFYPHLTVEQTRAWISKRKDTPYWAITDLEDRAIGFVGYHGVNPNLRSCMVAYHLSKAFWGRGIAPAAVRLTDAALFAGSTIQQISATVKPENLHSQRCLLKSGYTLERVIEDYQSSVTQDQSRIRFCYTKSR